MIFIPRGFLSLKYSEAGMHSMNRTLGHSDGYVFWLLINRRQFGVGRDGVKQVPSVCFRHFRYSEQRRIASDMCRNSIMPLLANESYDK